MHAGSVGVGLLLAFLIPVGSALRLAGTVGSDTRIG